MARSRRGVAEPDRRAEVEHLLGPVQRPGPRRSARPSLLPRCHPVDEGEQGAVDQHRIAGLGEVSATLDQEQIAARDLRDHLARRHRCDVVVRPLDDQRRAGDALEPRHHLLPRPVEQPRAHRGGEHLPAGASGPGAGVLDLLGRVRLAAHLAPEEVGEPLEVGLPHVLGEQPPPRWVVLDGVERVHRALGEVRDEQRDERSDHHRTEDAVGVQRGHAGGEASALRQAGDHRPVRARLVEDRDDVSDQLEAVVGRRVGRAVGPPVPAPIHRDHPVVACQRGDVRLPVERVGDGPGRQEQHRRAAALAEDLVGRRDAVADDRTLAIRFTRSHDAAPPTARRPCGRSSPAAHGGRSPRPAAVRP